MAENEVLDVRWGRRWKVTRQLLNQAEGNPAELAECVCNEAQRDVQVVVKRALQKGSTLVSIFEIAGGSAAAMRAAVSVFPDQQLARFTRLGCLTSPTKSAHDIAHSTAALMFDAFAQRTVVFSARYERWRDAERRQLLKAELEQRRQACVQAIATTLEKSLRGESVSLARRSRRPRVTAKVLVGRSLHLSSAAPSNGRNR